MASERLPSRPTCLLVASGAAEGVSAQSFLHCFTLASAAFNLQVATPGGKTMDFVDVNESNARWVQDFRLKAYASPAKLESIDEPICAVGHGVAALCCATNEDRSWVFQGYSVTGPSVYELVRAPGFARLPLIVEDFVKDAGAGFSGSDAVPAEPPSYQWMPPPPEAQVPRQRDSGSGPEPPTAPEADFTWPTRPVGLQGLRALA
ncbi:glutamine amidotransferase-like class 1 domain-containing protein 1 isoform X4 [Pipistrellus kuhlii]|uniref:glutamine amidotransferase-like class 1 domain-containing protein 1 isoform X4 n=1 Tax=Pipistrellus kuhlii TaxID=59472 RepID=UPI001E26FAE5|nr:glutamine amidotransferase-like class 1 domain-containing protein 1 isoform X4 [Pipistrellus kuhlii]